MSFHNRNMLSTYRIALLQMCPDLLNPGGNLNKAEEMLREAANNGAKLACLPESFSLGYANARIEDLVSYVQTHEDSTLARIRALAAELRIHILAPIFWKNEQGQVENRAFLIDDEGKLLGSYAKTHLTAHEKGHIRAGEVYPVFDTRLGKIGISICYDMCFPEVGRILALEGAQVILVCAAWHKSAYYQRWWDMNVAGRALDNLVYMAAVNQTGMADREEFLGRSQLCDPTGVRLCLGEDREEILYGDIDLDRATAARTENTVLTDRHPLEYRRICEQ